MNSPRIAAFRTHTVQSPYSMYLSPNPCHVLDGDHTYVPNVTPTLDSLVSNLSDKLSFLKSLLDSYSTAKAQRAKVIDYIRQLREQKIKQKRQMMHNCRKAMAAQKQREAERQKLSHDPHEMGVEEMEEMPKLAVGASLLSNPLPAPAQSPRTRPDHKEKAEENTLTISKPLDVFTEKKKLGRGFIKSNSSDSDDGSSEYISKEYQDQKKTNPLKEGKPKLGKHKSLAEGSCTWTEKEAMAEKERLDKVIYLTSSQLAPLLDRSGRAMIDLSPHLAMGSQQQAPTWPPSHFDFGSDTLTRSMSRRAGSDLDLPEPIARFLDPIAYSRPSEPNPLSTTGRPLHFQIPVMLTPGELLSTNSRQNSFVAENNVHLHISAQVHMPSKSVCNIS